MLRSVAEHVTRYNIAGFWFSLLASHHVSVPAESRRRRMPHRKRAEKSRPTLLDISRECGVSTATVSRVLNGSAGVAPETRGRVLAAMRRTNYTTKERTL